MGDLRQLNIDLARALGVGEVSNVRRVTLVIAPGEVPTVTVERTVLPDASGAKLITEITSLADTAQRMMLSAPKEAPTP